MQKLRQRWWLTLLVLIAAAVMVRLGIWQLDRLAQRRALNARLRAQIAAPPLVLGSGATVPGDLAQMEYRSVEVRGKFDPGQNVLLRNQAWQGQLGARLYTPLILDGTDQAILVERGWIPESDTTPAGLSRYDTPGQVVVTGTLRLPVQRPALLRVPEPTLAPGQTRRVEWNSIEIDGIAHQMPYSILPVYVQLAAAPAGSPPPIPTGSVPDLSDGPHLGYAIQWFSFAAISLVIYGAFVLRSSQSKENEDGNTQA